MEMLLAARAGSSPTISVVLPALDEARTVGDIVSAVRADLVVGARTGGEALVDEIVVLDSGSTDATAAVARQAGARVVQRHEVLSDIAPAPGKGEALWRGVAATDSDIVVFLDSDLEDFSTDFVTGLLGPLLTDPDVALVKATYDRPLRQGEAVLPAGGGRVTELVARPLINLFWPALAGFVQPLSGEYAGRRDLLERLPFPTGYGIELGMLVDALQLVGLDALAQVDLVRRKHRNSADAKLGSMGDEILQVALARLHSQGRLQLAEEVDQRLLQFVRTDGAYVGTDSRVAPLERPPLVDVPAYASARAGLR